MALADHTVTQLASALASQDAANDMQADAKNPQVNRLSMNKGTSYTGADSAIAISAGWGTTATFTAVTGSTDGRGRLTVSSSGSGQGANPTITITFKDGLTWGGAAVPFAFACMVSASTGTLAAVAINASTSTLTITYIGTPSAGQTYIFDWLTIG